MKKSALIICTVLTTFSLTALAYTTWNNESETSNKCCKSAEKLEPPTFVYDVDSRFIANISKEDIRNAKTIIDLVPEDAGWDNFEFKEVTIKVLPDENNKYAKGNSKELNLEQINLLKTIDYSTNFVVDTYIKSEHPSAHNHHPYYITVTPEKEASYLGGKEALINYLTVNCASTISKTERGNLKSGKAHFTISKEGTISNVNLESTSGYRSVDLKMMELIITLPGVWIPATNENGEKVEQELVFSFGTLGC